MFIVFLYSMTLIVTKNSAKHARTEASFFDDDFDEGFSRLSLEDEDLKQSNTPDKVNEPSLVSDSDSDSDDDENQAVMSRIRVRFRFFEIRRLRTVAFVG